MNLSRTALGALFAVALVAIPAEGSGRSQFHRRDAATVAEARALIAAEGLAELADVRCKRGRLVLRAEGLDEAARERLAGLLEDRTDAVSVSR